MSNLKILTVLAILVFGAAAQAEVVMRCGITNADEATEIVLERTKSSEPTQYTLEIIDPTALRPVAHLVLGASEVYEGASTVVVDAFESRVGSLQMMVGFDIGGSASKSVQLKADYRRADIRKNYNLTAFNRLASPGLLWACKR